MYLLDSNAWIAIFRQKSDALLNQLIDLCVVSELSKTASSVDS